MAINPSVLGVASLDQASGGNPALRAILQQLATAANSQATKTSTSGKQPPNQSSVAITFQSPLYILTFTDPGGAAAASLTQAAQQAAAAAAPLGSNPTQSVIYHQVQAATSILFDTPSNLETYGGDTGSLQTQFVIGDLSISKSWYFRFRTSYDGVTWNQWKLVSKSSTSVNVNAVSVQSIAGGQFAGITLPGKQIVGFGMGTLPNGGFIQTAEGVLLGNSLGIAGPSGYTDTGFEAQGLSACTINSLGQITLNYTDGGSNRWSGTANYLTFGWVAGAAQALTEQALSDGGRWVVVTLPGGSQLAFGAGTIADGGTFLFPPGFTAANSMGIVTPAVAAQASNPAYGVSQATVVEGKCQITWADSTGHSWGSTGNWFAMAWQPALSANLVTVTGGKYLRVPTLSGNVMIGFGQTATGGILPLPAGYTFPQCQAFSSPGTFVNTLQYAMHGVQACGIDVGLTTSIGTVTCLYGTVTGSRPGSANWFSIAWQ